MTYPTKSKSNLMTAIKNDYIKWQIFLQICLCGSYKA